MDAKELQKIIKILRKNGVIEYESAEFKLKLGPEPTPRYRQTKEEKSLEDKQMKYSDEDLLFWSSRGVS